MRSHDGENYDFPRKSQGMCLSSNGWHLRLVPQTGWIPKTVCRSIGQPKHLNLFDFLLSLNFCSSLQHALQDLTF